MQISTNDADYIIDTLELRSDLHVLNESFTSPNIVKVQLQLLFSPIALIRVRNGP